jgi:hypothetical protein
VPVWVLLGTAVGVAGSTAVATPSAFATSSTRPSISCGLISTAQINRVLKTSVGAPKVIRNGAVTVCTYPQGHLTDKLLIRYETGMNPTTFDATKTGFTSHGEPVTVTSGFGSTAFTSTIGSGTYAVNSLAALKGTTGLLVSASTSLARVEMLSTRILHSL